MKTSFLEQELRRELPYFRTISVNTTTRCTTIREKTFEVTLMTSSVSHIWISTIIKKMQELGMIDIKCESVHYSTTIRGRTLIETVLSVTMSFRTPRGVAMTL